MDTVTPRQFMQFTNGSSCSSPFRLPKWLHRSKKATRTLVAGGASRVSRGAAKELFMPGLKPAEMSFGT